MSRRASTPFQPSQPQAHPTSKASRVRSRCVPSLGIENYWPRESTTRCAASRTETEGLPISRRHGRRVRQSVRRLSPFHRRGSPGPTRTALAVRCSGEPHWRQPRRRRLHRAGKSTPCAANSPYAPPSPDHRTVAVPARSSGQPHRRDLMTSTRHQMGQRPRSQISRVTPRAPPGGAEGPETTTRRRVDEGSQGRAAHRGAAAAPALEQALL
jgi:hypothetical protein